MRPPNTAAFTTALRSLPVPAGRQAKFLKAHCAAPGQVLTATRLAKAAGYKSYGGINLQYGLLAQRIGKAMGLRDIDITVLVEGVEPKSVTNREWLLAIRPQFAKALRRVGWV